MLETTVILALCIWFTFFLVNYAEAFFAVREFVLPRLWPKLRYVASCPLCYGWWVMVALSLFVGFSPMTVTTPVCVLLLDLVFNKLRDGCK